MQLNFSNSINSYPIKAHTPVNFAHTSSVRFKGILPGADPAPGSEALNSFMHWFGDVKGYVTAPFSAAAKTGQLAEAFASTTAQIKILANHFINWMHKPELTTSAALFTGAVVGGAVVGQAAGPSIGKILRPDPTPVLQPLQE